MRSLASNFLSRSSAPVPKAEVFTHPGDGMGYYSSSNASRNEVHSRPGKAIAPGHYFHDVEPPLTDFPDDGQTRYPATPPDAGRPGPFPKSRGWDGAAGPPDDPTSAFATRADLGRTPKPALASRAGISAVSRHAPRPVTLRLLRGAHAARLGEATLLLDGAACGGVVFCGRVLARVGPDVNGSLTGPHPASSLVVSDGTGVIGVVQYHSRAAAIGAAAEGEGPSDGNGHGHGHGNRGGGRNFPTADAFPPRVGFGGVGHAILQALGGTFGDGDSIPAEEMDIRVDDYVLCVGRLCFTDVDPTVEKLFKSLPMAFHSCSSSGSAHAGNVDATPSEATSLRISGSAKASSSEAAMDMHNEPGGRSGFRASSDVYEDSIGDPMCLQPISSENQSIRDATHVLLPGAPSPIAVTDLLELGISLDNVPSGTRFFSAAESIDRSQPQAMQFGLRQECDSNDLVTRHSHCVRAAAPREVMCPTPPRICVKGKVRLISSSNEILFWCLSAIDTHVRLKSIALQRAVSYS